MLLNLQKNYVTFLSIIFNHPIFNVEHHENCFICKEYQKLLAYYENKKSQLQLIIPSHNPIEKKTEEEILLGCLLDSDDQLVRDLKFLLIDLFML